MFLTKGLILLFAIITFIQINAEVAKRELYGYDYGVGFPNFANFHPMHLNPAYPIPPPAHHGNLQGTFVPKEIIITGPSPAEIAGAIAAAKEATSNVIAAQQRVNFAKNDVLLQQKLASHKEAQALLALQQTEAAAAVQRQLASAAANAVVFAQQRLAKAKADVAEQQRIASERETVAALAIQRSAVAAAAEIRKTEHAAAKVAAINNLHANAVLKHVAAAKDASVAATSAAVNANIRAAVVGHGPWLIPQKVAHFGSW